jgi:chorismate mutase
MKLNKLRKDIDKCDTNIAKYLVKRFNIVKKVGEYKRKHNLPVYDPVREGIVKAKMRTIVGESLPENSIENIYQTIMDEAKKIE